MNEKNVDKEVGKHDQTQLKTPRRDVGGEEKYRQSSEKNKEKCKALSQCSKLAPDAT